MHSDDTVQAKIQKERRQKQHWPEPLWSWSQVAEVHPSCQKKKNNNNGLSCRTEGNRICGKMQSLHNWSNTKSKVEPLAKGVTRFLSEQARLRSGPTCVDTLPSFKKEEEELSPQDWYQWVIRLRDIHHRKTRLGNAVPQCYCTHWTINTHACKNYNAGYLKKKKKKKF